MHEGEKPWTMGDLNYTKDPTALSTQYRLLQIIGLSPKVSAVITHMNWHHPRNKDGLNGLIPSRNLSRAMHMTQTHSVSS